MGYFFGCGSNCSGPAGPIVAGKLISVVLTTAEADNLNPGMGWPVGYGRLDITPAAGGSSVTGLFAGLGADGLQIIIRNSSVTDPLTLPALDAASDAANQFSAPRGGVILDPLASVTGTYYAQDINQWVLTT